MAKNGKKIKAILELLSLELTRGELYYLIARGLHHRFNRSDLIISPSLLSGTYQACLNQAVLSLAKLGVHERESVSIEYLLNCASQNFKAFRFANRSEIETKIEYHRRLLGEQKPLLIRVKAMRDRMLAHLDRKHVNEPVVVDQLQIEFAEIEQCYNFFTEILNTYRAYYGQTQLDLSGNQRIIQDDLDRLFGRIDER